MLEIYFGYSTNKILILGKVGFQSDQITAASWSGNTCQPSNQLIITLIRLLFACVAKFINESFAMCTQTQYTLVCIRYFGKLKSISSSNHQGRQILTGTKAKPATGLRFADLPKGHLLT